MLGNKHILCPLFLALPANAQVLDVESAQQIAMRLVESASSQFDCEIALFGAPIREELVQSWHVTYSASGDGCSEAVETLQAARSEYGLNFVRRPTLGQVRGVFRTITESVGESYACQITLAGVPRADPHSGQWTISYLASGPDCAEASVELGRRGAELDIILLQRQSLPLINQ